MKKIIKKILIYTAAVVLGLAFSFFANNADASAKGKYTVKPKTNPISSSYTRLSTYNTNTKQYYMLKSYLEKLEKDGGGTLTIKKGTYNIPCTLYVPSNVTINLKKGAILKKTKKTGTKKLKATKTMFELVTPAKSTKKNKVKKYAGTSKVVFFGDKNSAMDMNNIAGATAIVMGHNKKVSVSGITFRNMKREPLITIAASKNVTIDNCTFVGYTKASTNKEQYAISLEIPDEVTGSFAYSWSKNDKTDNKNIVINDCTFTGVYTAIGSSKYTEEVYHNTVKVTNNTFMDTVGNVIKVLNWSTSEISGNTFDNVALGEELTVGVYVCGSNALVISDNSFNNIARPIYFAPAVNTDAGSEYKETKNIIDASTTTHLETNTVKNAKEYYVSNQLTLDGKNVVRVCYFTDNSTKDFVVSPESEPYHSMYTDNARYNSYTEDYFMLRSYLEQLEKVGGGTLTLQAGKYSITNTLNVPSNTTIVFQDGVHISKGTYTGFTDYLPSASMFTLVDPSMSMAAGALSGYNGAHDISFVGYGTAIIDMLYFNNCKTITFGHNKNVTIKNIQFYNYMGHHFIELTAAQNVVIEDCSFVGSKYTDDTNDHKEAINIDTPDRNTGGYGQVFTSYDRTPTDNIIIRNNNFIDSLRAIGTHKYSVSPADGTTQVYHTGIQILNNNIINTVGYAIRSINWKDCVIKGNLFKNINAGNTAAILMSGTVNPTITENTFDTAARPIVLNSEDNYDTKTTDKDYPMTHTILDSMEATGKNLSDMLNNMLIDMKTANNIRYFVGGRNKETSEKTLLYEFDENHIKYTYPTATPKPTKTPKPSASPDPEETPEPEYTPAPTETPEPVDENE